MVESTVMSKKPITIEMPEELLRSIDRVTRRHGPARAAVILTACQEYVRCIDEQRGAKKPERDAIRQYIKGYRRFPDTEPDPHDWAAEYERWLAEHPKGQ
jgi:hypothetical protein